MFKKIACAGRIRLRHFHFVQEWRRQLRRRLRAPLAENATCPICGCTVCRTTTFKRTEGIIEKQLCPCCNHLFSGFLQTDPALGQEMFGFDTENDGKATQICLLKEVAQRTGSDRATVLDFGVGGNLAAFQEAQRLMPQHQFMACDTYQSSTQGYFQTYTSESPLGKFDGISSYAVIEHLTATVSAWTYLNRLIKPMAAGGGIMVHAFPSQLHHDFDHWAIQIKSHVCLFSPKSLAQLCKMTGFKMVDGFRLRPVGAHAHGVMVFRKVKDT